MIKLFSSILFTVLLMGSLSCTVNKATTTSQQSNLTFTSIVFTDTLLVNKYPTPAGSTTTLQKESKIKSASYRDSLTAFNLGIVDFFGNGSFKDPSFDLFILTNPQNKNVRINSEYGTPHCSISDPLLFTVDEVLYRLSDIDPHGSSAKITRMDRQMDLKQPVLLTLSSYVRGLKLEKYTGGEALIDTMYSGKQLLFLYFWDTHLLETQMKKLEMIDTNYNNKVRIVGVHNKEHELDNMTKDNFFRLMAKPWNGYSCSTEQYRALYQEYSNYRGLLLDSDGRIIFPHISPKELLEWLEKQ
jgi:hypothetical protein